MHTERKNGVTLDKFPWLSIPQFFSNHKIRGSDLTASVISYIQKILWFSSFNNGTNDIKGHISISFLDKDDIKKHKYTWYS